MIKISVIFCLFLANRVCTGTETVIISSNSTNTNSEKYLKEEIVFGLQIQQIRSKETTVPASSGSNLSTTVLKPEHLPLKFQQDLQDINEDNQENYDFHHNNKPTSTSKHFLEILQNKNETTLITPSPLIWDNCKETLPKSHLNTSASHQPNDMEDSSKDIKLHHKPSSYRMIEYLIKRDIGKQSNESHTKIQAKSSKTQAEKRRQIKLDPVKETTTPTTIKIIPITRDIVKTTIKTSNMTIDSQTENNMKTSYMDDWIETQDKTKIRFGGLPQRETYLIPTLRFDEGFYPFSFMADFFQLIHPFDFPVGLVKDIVWGKLSFPYSFLYAINVESAFLVCIIIFVCIALIIPSYLFIVAILSLCGKEGGDNSETGALYSDDDDGRCGIKLWSVVTVCTVVLSCILITGMLISNEQAASVANQSRDALSCACADISTWLAASARELHHSIVPPVDMVLQAYKDDLRNVDILLGMPIARTISSESGIDMVFDSLADIIAESQDLSSKLTSLRDISTQAGALAFVTKDRLKDLSRQLDNVRNHCVGKDVPLCDTVKPSAMELKNKFNFMKQEPQLLELRALGVENLTRAISFAKQELSSLPTLIATQTAVVRDEILQDMETRRDSVYRSSRILNDIVRHLKSAVISGARGLEGGIQRFQNYDFWRWVTMLVLLSLFSFVMLLVLSAFLCSCVDAKRHAKRTLQVSTCWILLASFILWTAVSTIFIIAGHAEIYVCHTLYDSTEYKTLSRLFDRPSPLFSDEEGIFDALFRDLENVTIDVSVTDVLRECERDETAYNVFQLDKFLDVNKETSYFEWKELQTDMGKLSATLDIDVLTNISNELNVILNKMLVVTDVDLAFYRLEYNGPIVGKDLLSLADQLENVAAQVTDLTTSSRLEALASRTKKLDNTNIKPLEQYKAEVVYKLTELELQMMPFRRKLNISLSHIHTAQFYINSQRNIIAEKKVSIYTSRLISHVAAWRSHVLTSTSTQAARCKPLFSVFDAARSFVCSQYVSSLHGWWVGGFFLGIIWCCLTPMCVKVWRICNKRLKAEDAMSLANLGIGHQSTPTTAMCDNNWNTPGPPPQPTSNNSW